MKLDIKNKDHMELVYFKTLANYKCEDYKTAFKICKNFKSHCLISPICVKIFIKLKNFSKAIQLMLTKQIDDQFQLAYCYFKNQEF